MSALQALRALVVAIVCMIAATCQQTASDTPAPAPTHVSAADVPTPAVVAPAITFDAVGDSITSWEGLEVTGATRTDTSWTTAVGPTVHLDGGWARGGAEAQQMADAIATLDLHATAFALLAGTNDVRHGHDNAPTLATIEHMAADADARDQCVILVAVPPLDTNPTQALDLNAGVAAIASAHTWVFVDPWIPWRVDGQWVAGASSDGIHPTRDVADHVGATLAGAIAGCVGGEVGT